MPSRARLPDDPVNRIAKDNSRFIRRTTGVVCSPFLAKNLIDGNSNGGMEGPTPVLGGQVCGQLRGMSRTGVRRARRGRVHDDRGHPADDVLHLRVAFSGKRGRSGRVHSAPDPFPSPSAPDPFPNPSPACRLNMLEKINNSLDLSFLLAIAIGRGLMLRENDQCS